MKKDCGDIVRSLGALLVGVVSAAGTAPANADVVILQPTAIGTNMSNGFGANISQLRDQSGLSLGYVSLSTDLNTYVSAGPTHNSSLSNNNWQTGTPPTLGYLDFALGGTYSLERFVLWNLSPLSSSRLNEFQLLASSDSAFTTTTNLGSFATNTTGSGAAVNVEAFTLPATNASFVRLLAISNGALMTSSGVGIGEVAFGVNPAAAVPESSALALVGLVGTMGAAWRVRSARRRGGRRRLNRGAESDEAAF